MTIKKNDDFFSDNLIDKSSRCFIFAQGPSLNKFDPSILKDEDVLFCANSFYLTELSKKVKINYYSIINKNWFDNIENDPEKYGTDLEKTLIKLNNNFPDSVFLFHDKYFENFKSKISKQIKKKYYFNYSQIDSLSYLPLDYKKKIVYPRPVDVSHFNLMIAYYMGFKEIYLVGLDHSETTDHSKGHERAHSKISKEDAAFLSDGKFNKNSIYMKSQGGHINDAYFEGLNLNNYWWRWYRALIYYQTIQKLNQRNIKIYRVENDGTLDFIPVKTPK